MAPSKKKSAKKPAKKSAPVKKAAKKPAKKSAPLKKSAAPAKKSAAPVKTPKIVTISSSAFQPIEDRILVAVEEASETTSGGIIIPGNVESRPNRGTVLAKGPGRRGKKGRIRPLDVNVGDSVLFPEYAGTKIQIEGDDFLILREDDLLGVVTL